MGVLTDVYISAPDEALSYDVAPQRFEDRSISAKGIMDLELSTLWCIYRGEEWSVDVLDEFKHLMSADGGERIIAELPADLMQRLANTDDRQLTEILPAWAATEELNVEPEVIEPYLRDLIALAKRASADNERLYIWICV